jgi:nucleotide-binding universal stress UspA family protein
MYKRILLASDGTRESLVALREGALLAKSTGAHVWLLIIQTEAPAVRVADGIYPAPRDLSGALDLLQQGLSRLSALGVQAEGEVVIGEPTMLIAKRAKAFGAGLVVVGHRRTSMLERWWSGSSGGYLVDSLSCSVLVAREVVSDAVFDAHLAASSAVAAA